MPPWIPQNIQKRLLLYVLQQLSLFSEIDLPNLEEVSMNSIVLKDVSIDPEKVGKLPGCNLRYGQVGSFELSTGGSSSDSKPPSSPSLSNNGGVFIDAHNVEIVISPDFDVNEDISTSVQFSLAQSTANLANTIMLPIDKDDSTDDDFEEAPKSRSNSSSSARPSTLSGVMARAVEMALSRLQVKIHNLKIKIVSEMTDLVLEIDHLVFSTINGVRHIELSGVRLITLKPLVNPGEKTKKQKVPKKNGTSETSSESEVDYSDESEIEEDESLMDSMLFTHDEASSIYMSATSKSFQQSTLRSPPVPPQAPPKDPPTILHIDRVSIDFKGLSTISHLKVDVGTVKLAFVPMTPTIVTILNGITRSVKIKNYQKRKEKAKPSHSGKFPQYNEDDEVGDEILLDASDEQLFSKLHIDSIIVSGTSALSASGEFESENSLNFILSNLNVKQKTSEWIYGGVEVFSAVRQKDETQVPVFQFTEELGVDGPAKADIRFEIFKKENSEFTVLCSKEALISLDPDSLSILLNFMSGIDSIHTSWKNLDSSMEASSKNKKKTTLNSQFLLQTASIKISTLLDSTIALHSTISPISFNLLQDEMKIATIVVTCTDSVREFTVLALSSMNLITKTQEFRTFLHTASTGANSSSLPREVSMAAATSLVVQKIVIGVDLEDAENILKAFSDFSSQLSINPPEKSVYFKTDSSSISQRRKRLGPINNTCSFRLLIKYIEFNINSTPLGTFTSSIYDVCVKQMAQEVIGSVFCIDTKRRAEEEVEKVIYEYRGNSYETTELPIVMVKYGYNVLDINVRGLLIEYYGVWLGILERNQSKSSKRPETSSVSNVSSSPDISSKSSARKLDIRFTFLDCIIGATPITLPSKLYLAIDRCNTDLTFAPKKVYVKSSLRNISAYLIDDVSNTKNNEQPRRHFRGIPQYTPPSTYYTSLGYIRIGKINNVHVGVTFEEKSIDIKVNSDEQQVELCADSMQCIASLAADLKLPVNFEDDEKMRVCLSQEINLLEDIDRDQFEWKEPLEREISEMSIVDEYVDDQLYAESLSGAGSGTLGVSQETLSLNFTEDHFSKNQPVLVSAFPITVNVNLSKTKVYFYDGYDWEDTRVAIREAVARVEEKAKRKQKESRKAKHPEDSINDTDSRSPSKNHPKGAENGAEPDLDSLDLDSMESSDIEENLFQSIYLGVPSTYTTGLREAINFQVNSDKQDEASGDSSVDLGSPKKPANVNVDAREHSKKRLNLNRSVQCKAHLDIKNIEVSVAVNSSGNVLNSVEVSVETFNIYDNIPTSSWHKLLSSGGEKREIGTQMLKLSLVNVRPDEGVVMGEVVVRLSLMPLRLYIDQDMVEFLTRFFGFKDERFSLIREEEDIFFEKFQMDELKLCIDYKPKSVDYTGIRGGKYAELLNFFSLEGSEIKLDAVTVFGQRGVPKLLDKLGSCWAESFTNSKNSKILKVLIGLSMFRSIYNIGGNLRDLVVVPLTSKDDKLKAVQKQSVKFLKSVGYEVVRMGVKLSTGAQVLLEQGEEYLEPKQNAPAKTKKSPKQTAVKKMPKQSPNIPKTFKRKTILESSQLMSASVFGSVPDQFGSSKLYSYVDLEDEDDAEEDFLKSVFQSELQEESNAEDSGDEFADMEETEAFGPIVKPVSLYSNQPANVQQGVKHAYKSINKNIKQTQRRVLQLLDELEDAESVGETFKVLLQGSPLVVIRPLIGTTEAISKTLMGLGNNIDSRYLRESRDKYQHDSESE